MATVFSVSFQEGSLSQGFTFTGHWQNYTDTLARYDTQLIRSLMVGLIVTIMTLVISYPMMYWIAFRGGRRKNIYLLLILLPFFTPFLIRTLMWKTIFADEGILLGFLKDVGLVSDSYQVLATMTAVISGMVYNFLPFMALPLYVSLEKMDPRLLDAAADLYSSKRQAFLKVTLPLSYPGLFAGSLLTFIPAVGDPINPELLGGVNTTMIGQVVQREMLTNNAYPRGSAISFMLMAVILIGVFLYARVLGTEEMTG
ncbi:MAG: ABC transporter permease subunit [Actinobacteria bacterium]|nr:ABC transporter permease subunit [Actinomycetota bacterium]